MHEGTEARCGSELSHQGMLCTLLLVVVAALAAYVVLVSADANEGFGDTGIQRAAVSILLGIIILLSLYLFYKHVEGSRTASRLRKTELREATLRCRLTELSALFEAALEINSQLDLGRVLTVVARRVTSCFEADRASVFLPDDSEPEVLRCHAVWGTNSEVIREVRIRVGEGIAGWVMQNKEILVLNDDRAVRRHAEEVKPGRGISAALCAPIVSGGRAVGVLSVSRIERDRPFTAVEVRLMRLFGEHIGTTIERARELAALNARRFASRK